MNMFVDVGIGRWQFYNYTCSLDLYTLTDSELGIDIKLNDTFEILYIFARRMGLRAYGVSQVEELYS